MRRAAILLALCACRTRTDDRAARPPMLPTNSSAMAPTPERAIDVSDGMSSPEAVVHDTVADVYLVSNINGAPDALDDNGYILRMSPDGAVLDQKWIDGARPDITLHGPRGMAIHGDTLYVVDRDAVRLFDRATGAPKGEWPVPDPHFPNDLRVADDGSVYVTETGIYLDGRGPKKTGPPTIWRFTPDGKPEVFAQGDELDGPNGIVLAPAGPILAGFMGTDVYQWANGAKQVIAKLPDTELDGLTQMPDGTLFVTSWTARGVYAIAPDGKWKLAYQDPAMLGPASIEIDHKRKRLIIPLVLANQVRIEPL